MANIYSDKTEDWTYYNTTRLDVHSFRFNGVGAYATTVIGNGGGDGGEDTEQELGGELVFRGVVSPAQSSLSQGLRCRIDIYSKQDAEQENWETESHFIYIKGDRNGAINQKVNVRNGAYDHINLKIEVLSDAEMSLDNTIDLTSFIIHDAALIADLSVIREKIEEGETGLSTLEEETLNLFNVISGSLGFYSTVVEYEDGSKISYIHDKPKLENSMVIATQTESGWASTTTGWNDGEPAWTYGVTFDGSLVMNVVSAVGINAEWITLSSGSDLDTAYTHIDGGNITTGTIQGGKVKLDLSEGTFLIGDSSTDYSMYFDGTDLYLGGATSLSWGNITNKPNIPSVPGYITSTKITATTIESPNIVGNAGQIANFSIREKHIGANATDGSWWYIATYGATHPTTGVPLNHLIRMHDGSNNPLFGVSVNGEVAAKSFVNLTPAYTGNALEEIAKIKADSKGDIDHSTLPKFAQAKIEKMTDPNIIVDKGEMQIMSAHEPEYIEGQDIGAMVSVLTKAVQELIAKNEELDAAISALGQKMA